MKIDLTDASSNAAFSQHYLVGIPRSSWSSVRRTGQVCILSQMGKYLLWVWGASLGTLWTMRDACERRRWLQQLKYPCPYSVTAETCKIQTILLSYMWALNRWDCAALLSLEKNRLPREDVGDISICSLHISTHIVIVAVSVCTFWIWVCLVLVYISLCYYQSMLSILLHFSALSVQFLTFWVSDWLYAVCVLIYMFSHSVLYLCISTHCSVCVMCILRSHIIL